MTGGVAWRPASPVPVRAHRGPAQPVRARATASVSSSCITEKGREPFWTPLQWPDPWGGLSLRTECFCLGALSTGAVKAQQHPTGLTGAGHRQGANRPAWAPMHSPPTAVPQTAPSSERPPRPRGLAPAPTRRPPGLTRVLAFRNTWLSMSLLDLLWATPAFLMASSLEYKGGETLTQAPWPAPSQQLSGAHGRPAHQHGRGPGQPWREGPSVQ